ncbi:hypothetical protein SGLAM104S_03622 [Streptomyces glaucescens]
MTNVKFEAVDDVLVGCTSSTWRYLAVSRSMKLTLSRLSVRQPSWSAAASRAYVL